MKKFNGFLKAIFLAFLVLNCSQDKKSEEKGNPIVAPTKITINIPNIIVTGGVPGNYNPNVTHVKIFWSGYNSSLTSKYLISVFGLDSSCSCPSSTPFKPPIEVANNVFNKLITGLISDKSYFIKVEALKSDGSVISQSSSEIKSFVTAIVNGVNRPNFPQIITSQTKVLRKTVNIKWEKNTDLSDVNGQNMKYTVKVKDSNGVVVQTFLDLSSTTLEKEITGLDPNVQYQIEITAKNISGSVSDVAVISVLTKKTLAIDSFTPTPGADDTATTQTANIIYVNLDYSNAIDQIKREFFVNGRLAKTINASESNSFEVTNNAFILASTREEQRCSNPPTCNTFTTIPEDKKTYSVKMRVTDQADGTFVETPAFQVTMNFEQ